MSVSIGNNLYSTQQVANNATSKSSTDKLSNTISGLSKDSSDEELMAACKSFEEYLVEQVVKSTKSAMLSNDEEEDNEYLSMFSDNINQQYAKLISENSNLGIAQMLYESIKVNQSSEDK